MPKQVTNVACVARAADDALTTIYRLSHDEQEEVIAARVAERLDIKPASAAGCSRACARATLDLRLAAVAMLVDRRAQADRAQRHGLREGGADGAAASPGRVPPAGHTLASSGTRNGAP